MHTSKSALSCLLFVITAFCSFAEANKKDRLYFVQNNTTQVVEGNHTHISLQKAPFEIQFYNHLYQPNIGLHHSMRITAFYNAEQIPEMKEGMPIADIPCFKPGTSMALSTDGCYHGVRCNAEAHAYLFYADAEYNRLRLIKKKKKLSKFSFSVDTIRVHHFEEDAISEISIDVIHLAWVKDLNQNEVLDEGEFGVVSIHFSDKNNDQQIPYWNQQDSVGRSPLHRLMLRDMNNLKRARLIHEALSFSTTDPNIQDSYGNTPLHYAMVNGSTNSHYFAPHYNYSGCPDGLCVLVFLDDKRVNPNLKNYYFQYTPLQSFLALSECGVNRLTPLSLLFMKVLNENAQFNKESRDAVGMSAYDYVLKRSFMNNETGGIVELLKPETSFNANVADEMVNFLTQIDFNTPLSDSTFYLENTQTLLDYEVYPNTFTGGQTIFHYLCDGRFRPYGYSHEEIIANSKLRALVLTKLFNSPKLEINLADSEGNNALFYAIDDCNPIILSALLAHPDIDIYQINKNGNTPLMKLLKNGISSRRMENWEACFKMLSAQFSSTHVCVSNYNGETLLDIMDDFILKYDYKSMSSVVEGVKDFRNKLITSN